MLQAKLKANMFIFFVSFCFDCCFKLFISNLHTYRKVAKISVHSHTSPPTSLKQTFYITIVWLWKIGNEHWHNILNKLQILFNSYDFFFTNVLVYPRISHCISYYFSFIVSNRIVFYVFHVLLKNTGQIFYQIPLVLVFPVRLCISGKTIMKVALWPSHWIISKGSWYWHVLLPVMFSW